MKNTTSFVVGLVLLIAVGFVSYKAGQKSVPVLTSAASVEEKVKTDLIELTKNDFEEYKNLKTMEDRYKKADEILGKIVTVFLADLGLKLGYKPSNPALLEGACAIPGITPVATPLPSVKPQMSSMSAEPTPTPTVKALAWLANEKKLAGLDREEDILSSLKGNPIDDMMATLKSSSEASRDDLLKIEGHFFGQIHFFDRVKYNTDWNIDWVITLSSDTQARNSSIITLARKSDGHVFSRDNSNGDYLKNFTRPNGSKALMINVHDNDGYLQIYPVGDTDHWAGNYYEKVKFGQFQFVGQVTLNRL